MRTTTLVNIRWCSPCTPSWKALLKALGKDQVDSEPLPLSEIHRILGTRDALWATRTQSPKAIRELALQYAEEGSRLSKQPQVHYAIKAARELAKGETQEFSRETAVAGLFDLRDTAGESAVRLADLAIMTLNSLNIRDTWRLSSTVAEIARVAGLLIEDRERPSGEIVSEIFLEWANS